MLYEIPFQGPLGTSTMRVEGECLVPIDHYKEYSGVAKAPEGLKVRC